MSIPSAGTNTISGPRHTKAFYFHPSKSPKKFAQATPRPSEFSLDLIFPKTFEISPKRPLMLFSTYNACKMPTHRRQPSVVIKNISEIYSLTPCSSDFQNNYEEEVGKITEFNKKNSMFASTTDRGSRYESFFRQSCSDIEEDFESEGTELGEVYCANTKPDENLSTIGMNTQEEINETTKLGILPTKIFCKYCKSENITDVSIVLPTLPFWKVICCVRNFFEVCNDSKEKYQEFQHKCHQCKKVVGVGHPI